MTKHGRAIAPLVAAILLISGCGADKNAQTEVTDTVTAFLNSAMDLDAEGALACVDESSDYYGYCAENGPLGLNAEALDPANFLGDGTDELLGDSGDKFIDGIIDLLRRHSSFTVDSVELTSKNKATAAVTMTLPDFDSVDTDSLTDGGELPFDVEDFLAYAADKGYDQDAFLALDQSDGENLIFEYMQSAGYLDGVIETVLSALDKNVTADSLPIEFTLRRSGGKWKIIDGSDAATSENE